MSVHFTRRFNKSIYSKIILAFLLGCLTLLLAAGISRFTFRKILGTVDQLSRPNPKMKLVNKLFQDAVRLDQLQRTQSLKAASVTYNPLLKESRELQRTLDTLKRISYNNPVYLKRIDSMKHILQERDLLFINYLKLRARLIKNDTLSRQIRSLSEFVAASDNDSSIVTVEKKITTTTIQPADSAALKTEVKPSFWDKLLGRKKTPAVTKMEKLITEELNIKIDTLAIGKEDSIMQELGAVLTNAGIYQENRRNTLVKRQMDLARNSNVLVSQLFRILKDIENEELVRTEQNNLAAATLVNNSINNMNLILLIFIVGAGVLVILMFTDISRSNKYRKQLVAAKEEAEELGKVKQRFLANMSHELRTPLQSIIGFSEQLSMQGSADTEDLKIIYQSSKYLLQTVNEVLDYSGITSGKFELREHEFDISQLVSEVCETMLIQARLKGLELIVTTELQPREKYVGDSFRLKQILYNLLGNAIKFTDHGTVTLEITRHDYAQRTLFTISVKDTGIGIAADDLERIFSQFEQGAQLGVPQRQGTGLGLSIVQKLVEAQKGTVSVNSEPGKGSEFLVAVSYPRWKQKSTHDPEDEGLLPGTFHGEVWIVDDDPFILHLCDTILSKYAIGHTCFSSPEAVLQATLSPDVKVVFIDIRMPEINGPELCERLRAANPSTTARFVALTAQALPDEHEIILAHGFNELLMKPFLEKDLLNVLLKVQPVRNVQDNSDVPDLSQLLKMTGGDQALLLSILKSFIEESSADLVRLKEHIDHNQGEAAAETLHRLAGRCGQVGGKELTAAIRKTELDLRNGSRPEDKKDQLEYITDQVSSLISAIKQYTVAST